MLVTLKGLRVKFSSVAVIMVTINAALSPTHNSLH